LALVDREIADTLGELERKLRELEHVLSGIGQGAEHRADRGEQSHEDRQRDEVGGDRRGNERRADRRGDELREDYRGDERREDRRRSYPPANANPGPAGEGRVIDEAVVSEEPMRGGSLATTATIDAGAGSDADANAPAGAAGATTIEERGPPRAGRRPPPLASRSPSAAELLRFRDRLERTARELTHDYDELLGRITYAAVPAPTGPTISFARGAPSLDIIDVEGLRDAAVRAFESDPGGTTAYGTSIGYPRLRAWIADRHGVEPERVLVTNGSMQADAFLFEHFVRPGDDVVVERPSYDRTLLSLRERGANLHAVELQPDGIDTEVLARLLGGGRARPKLAHIIPNFQNPAGYTLSLAKRQALLALAAQYGFPVFEDDPYVALRFSGESLPTMLSMDPERVVYASSFSKTVCPGVRVGYLVGPPEAIEAIARLATNTYISPSMVAQSIVYEFCASGAIERSIERVRAALAERALTLAEALRRDLPDAEFVEPEGGYFMWVTLPPGTDVDSLHHAAAELGVSFVKGSDFVLEGGHNTLRLAYSGVTPEQIDEGVTRLAAAYRSL
jgi:DNA-binding transcriptional MocR family regulator